MWMSRRKDRKCSNERGNRFGIRIEQAARILAVRSKGKVKEGEGKKKGPYGVEWKKSLDV